MIPRDNDAYIAIAGLVSDAGEFAAVLRGRQPADLETTGQRVPRAWVAPAGWKEESISDPEMKQRTVRFQILLSVDATSHAEPEQELDRLANVVMNRVSGADFGFCLPHMTRVAEATFPAGEPYPRLSVVLKGTFAYLLSGDDPRSTEPGF